MGFHLHLPHINMPGLENRQPSALKRMDSRKSYSSMAVHAEQCDINRVPILSLDRRGLWLSLVSGHLSRSHCVSLLFPFSSWLTLVLQGTIASMIPRSTLL